MIVKLAPIVLTFVVFGHVDSFPIQAVSAKRQLEALYLETRGPIEKPPNGVLVCLSDKIPATVVPTAVEVVRGVGSLSHVFVDIENGLIKRSYGGPIHAYFAKGEMLRITIRKVHDTYIELGLHTLNPQVILEGQHTLQTPRGTTFLDKSPRILFSQIKFYFPKEAIKGNDITPIMIEIDKWFRLFKDVSSAQTFVSANSFVPEIKIGMSIAEVEKILGLPLTKLTLSDRIVYRYRDLTIEFRQGFVFDIKY